MKPWFAILISAALLHATEMDQLREEDRRLKNECEDAERLRDILQDILRQQETVKALQEELGKSTTSTSVKPKLIVEQKDPELGNIASMHVKQADINTLESTDTSTESTARVILLKWKIAILFRMKQLILHLFPAIKHESSKQKHHRWLLHRHDEGHQPRDGWHKALFDTLDPRSRAGLALGYRNSVSSTLFLHDVIGKLPIQISRSD
jgi:hypothetical protein